MRVYRRFNCTAPSRREACCWVLTASAERVVAAVKRIAARAKLTRIANDISSSAARAVLCINGTGPLVVSHRMLKKSRARCRRSLSRESATAIRDANRLRNATRLGTPSRSAVCSLSSVSASCFAAVFQQPAKLGSYSATPYENAIPLVRFHIICL